MQFTEKALLLLFANNKTNYMRFSSVLVLLVFFTACKFVPSDNSKNESFLKEGPAFSVLLNPTTGSTYQYNVSNKTSIDMEVNNEKLSNKNNSDVILAYSVGRDSANDIVLRMKYEKIKKKRLSLTPTMALLV
jgi:uncharacterized membrane protein YkgB